MDEVSTIKTLTSRRPKWQYPPSPPTLRFPHLPRRPRRKTPAMASQIWQYPPAKPSSQKDRKGKLENLFGLEREFARGGLPIVMVSNGKDDMCEEERRVRVEERQSMVMEEEKWRFQAEMLRAECNLLRMKREIAVKKMERRRVQVERTLRSAVQILLSVREKMCDGESTNMVLEEEIIELTEKLDKLQRRSSHKNLEVRKCSNFDKQVYLLQRQLEKIEGESDEIRGKEIQEMAEASLSIKTTCSIDETFVSRSNSSNMEILRRKMEGLSKGSLLERIEEEYGPILSTYHNSASSSEATSKRIELLKMSSSSIRQQCRKERKLSEHKERACSGFCKALVRRVANQVRAETEQWSQMQEMLGQVRDEMEELQASRDFWEDRALDSDHQVQSLQSAVKEWKEKAVSSEAKANELRAQVSVLRAELERLMKEKSKEATRIKNLAQNSNDARNEMEKTVMVCRLKEKRQANDNGRSKQKEVFRDGRKKASSCSRGINTSKRSPFRDIGNSSPLVKQNSRAVFHCTVPCHFPISRKNL